MPSGAWPIVHTHVLCMTKSMTGITDFPRSELPSVVTPPENVSRGCIAIWRQTSNLSLPKHPPTFAHCTSAVLHDDVQGHWFGPYHRFLLSHNKLWTVNCMACLWWGGVGFANLKFLWCDIYFNFISRCVSSCSGLVVLSGMCATYPHCMEEGCRSCYSECTVMWCYIQYIHTYVRMYVHTYERWWFIRMQTVVAGVHCYV